MLAKMAPHHVGSLSLLENVLLISSGSFGGPLFFRICCNFAFLCVFVCWGCRRCSHMFGIILGPSYAAKDCLHYLGSLSLLENVLLIASGCFGGPCFSDPQFASILSLCGCLLALGGILLHVWNRLWQKSCSQRWCP